MQKYFLSLVFLWFSEWGTTFLRDSTTYSAFWLLNKYSLIDGLQILINFSLLIIFTVVKPIIVNFCILCLKDIGIDHLLIHGSILEEVLHSTSYWDFWVTMRTVTELFEACWWNCYWSTQGSNITFNISAEAKKILEGIDNIFLFIDFFTCL